MTIHWTAIWGTHSPTKVSVAVWHATKDKILTIDNLIRRRKVIVNQCRMCLREKQWRICLSIVCLPRIFGIAALVWWGMSWVPATVVELIKKWYGDRGYRG